MRKLALSGAVLTAGVLAFGTNAFGVPGKKPPPVTIEGKVTNKGTKSVKKNKIEIETDNYHFKPTFVKAKPGSTITVKLKNESKTKHTFTIPSLGIDKTLRSGKSATVKVTVPPTGALGFFCRFHGPNGTSGDFGMQGAVFTQEGDTVVAVTGTTPSSAPPSTASTNTSPATSTPPTAPSTTRSTGGYRY